MKHTMMHIGQMLCLAVGILLFVRCQDADEYRPHSNVALTTNRDEATIRVGKTDTVIVTSGSGHYKVLAMNTNVVNANIKDSLIGFTGLREGVTDITLFDTESEKTHNVKVNVLNRIPDLSVSAHQVRVVEEQSYVVNVIQGSGDYEITQEGKVGDRNIVNVELQNGKQLHITGVVPGDASITVTDRQTHQHEEIRVRVEHKVPDLHVQTLSLDLYEQEKRVVLITSGSGTYSANPDNPRIVRVRITDGNTINIEALHVGQTKVFVLDEKSQQRVEIGVQVKPFVGVNPFVKNGIRYSYVDPNSVEVMALAGGKKYTGIVRVPTAVVNDERANTILKVVGVAQRAFMSCTGLTEVILPNSILTIGADAFNGCEHLTRVNLPKGLRRIGKNAFNFTALTTLDIPSTVDAIDLPFCLESPLQAINVAPDNQVYHSEDGVLYTQEEDEYADEPNTMVKVLAAMPSMKHIEHYTIPAKVVYVKPYAFYGQRFLKTLNTSEDCEELQGHAFENCHHLESITLQDGVDLIGTYCFFGDEKVKEIRCFGYPPTVEMRAFADQVYNNATVTAPKSEKDRYIYASYWEYFKKYKFVD